MASPMTSRDFMKVASESLNNVFDEVYGKWALNKLQLVYIRRGRYEIHKYNKRVAKNIKHRREALALMKLMQATQE
jgi:hypothetical protein